MSEFDLHPEPLGCCVIGDQLCPRVLQMFSLKIMLTPASLAGIKASLTRTLGYVKSSHRCEAIARGLGLRTYATALAMACSADQISVQADGRQFRIYLLEHGFDVPHQVFYRAVAHVALADVVRRIPKLAKHGIGIGRPRQIDRTTWESDEELKARFDEERAFLLSDAAIEPFLQSLAFLARVPATKTIRPDTSSYRLKHIVEEYACTYPEGGTLGPQYVMTGAFVAAAVHAGFVFKATHDDLGFDAVVSSHFNMSHKALDDLNYEILPFNGRSEDRRRRAELRKYPDHPMGRFARRHEEQGPSITRGK